MFKTREPNNATSGYPQKRNKMDYKITQETNCIAYAIITSNVYQYFMWLVFETEKEFSDPV